MPPRISSVGIKGLEGSPGFVGVAHDEMTSTDTSLCRSVPLAPTRVVRFLWVPADLLKIQYAPCVSEVLAAWGFDYQTKGSSTGLMLKPGGEVLHRKGNSRGRIPRPA